VPVGAILTDNGREYCGRPDQHPYELLLALENIKHRTTQVRSPRTKGYASYCTSLVGCDADLLRRAHAESPFHV